MDIPVLTLPFAVAAVLAVVMGFAIQRGATCTVAAVEQVVLERRTQRLRSILAASAWVLAGLLLAHALGVSMNLPSGYRVGAGTLLGGALLGFGAFVNQSCVFGSIAKLGSGYWSYAATPIGYYIGCLLIAAQTRGAHADSLPHVAPTQQASALLAAALLAALSWLALRAAAKSPVPHAHSLRARMHHLATRRVWEPGAATAVIGLTFLGMLLLVGAWTYTDALADFARGMRMSLLARCLLFLALFAGALVGGWSAGRLQAVAPSPLAVLRCFVGGVLMGVGSWLIPGGNDGLILVGMPLLCGRMRGSRSRSWPSSSPHRCWFNKRCCGAAHETR